MRHELRDRLETLRVAVDSLQLPQEIRETLDGAHHWRLAGWTHELFDDDPLTESAFLHGIPLDALSELEPTPEAGVCDILEQWERLRRGLKRETHGPEPRMITEVLPGLRDPRAAPLLALERLDRWDPERSMLRWSQSFRTDPIRYTSTLPDIGGSIWETGERAKIYSPWSAGQEAAHLRNVAAAAAQYAGLWEERNALENLALLAQDEGSFHRIVAWCEKHSATTGPIRQMEAAIARLLGLSKGGPCEWSWHHVASIAAKLDTSRAESRWDLELSRCGFVTVTCANPESCYLMLGRLHRSSGVEHDNASFRDSIARPTFAGYKALHTSVTLPIESRRSACRVRFVPKTETGRKPWIELLAERLEEGGRRADTIRVYTPAGAFRDLPAGATVLNFAEAVHRHFVGRVEHAKINEQETVDVLHRLSDGDRVELIESDIPKMPPSGWLEQIPQQTRRRIRACLRSNLRPGIREAGLRTIRTMFEKKKISDIDTESLETLIGLVAEDACEKVFTAPSGRKAEEAASAEWWTEQYGLLAQGSDRDEMPIAFKLDEAKQRAFEEALEALATRLRIDDSILELPANQRLRRISRCPHCQPPPGEDLEATSEGSTLVLHQAGSECARGGSPVLRRTRPTLDQRFIIEAEDRTGLLSDMLGVFHGLGIEVIEVAARRLGVRWAVARMEIDLASRLQVRTIRQRLMDTPGIVRVIGPGDPPVQILLDALPPPTSVRAQRLIPTPYVCGQPVRDVMRFYGRSQELTQLGDLLDDQGRGARAGAVAFVKGPLKTGKTSLVLRFGLELERNQAHRAVFAYYQAKTEDRWSDVTESIESLLVQEVERFCRSWNEHIELRGEAGLAEMLQTIRSSKSSPKVVIVVDEALRPFRNVDIDLESTGDTSELDAIKDTVDLVHNCPGCMLVWVGPTAPVNHLQIELATALRAAESILVTPLTRQDAKMLLAAHQLSWRQRIVVSKNVSQRAWIDTGGNPYWLNLLGDRMWKTASRGNWTREIRYTLPHLKAAREDLLGEDSLFVDQVFPDKVPATLEGWTTTLLERLLEAHADRDTRRDGLSISSLLAGIDSTGSGDLEAMPSSFLKDLEAMGSVRRSGDRVSLSSPLVADWLRSFLDRRSQ